MTVSRRDLLRGRLRPVSAPTKPAPPASGSGPAVAAGPLPEIKVAATPRRDSGHVEYIPTMWVLPRQDVAPARLAVWLCGGIAGMNASGRELDALAEAGFTGVSFDSWDRGRRAPEAMAVFFPRLAANFRQLAWPLIGNGALELLRVLDWAADRFGAEPPFLVGGHALGGDIAVAAAGLDPRIGCVAAITASPDWLRPGMHALGKPVAAGQPDAYARWFYEHLDPLTHVNGYAHCPTITFECGADDDHVPPDGALRFQQALRAGPYAATPDRVRVNLHQGVAHEYIPAMWDNCLAWFSQH